MSWWRQCQSSRVERFRQRKSPLATISDRERKRCAEFQPFFVVDLPKGALLL